ncbi:MAG: hypothetical protein WCS50_01415 [Bacilli bacterium]
MNNKKKENILNALKEEFAALSVPDVREAVLKTNASANETETRPWPRPTLIAFFAAIALFIAIGVFFHIAAPMVEYYPENEKEVFAFEAFSAAAIMPDETDFGNLSFPLTAERNPEIAEDIDYIHKYIYLIEGALTLPDKLAIEPLNNSAFANYEFQERIVLKTAFSDFAEYEMYYNLTEAGDDWNASGIIVRAGKQYSFTAEKKTKNKKTSITLAASRDDDNGVTIRQNISEAKNVYHIRVRENAEEREAILRMKKNIRRFEIEITVDNKKFICYRRKDLIRIEARHRKKVNIDINKNMENGEYEYRNNQNKDVTRKKSKDKKDQRD